MEERRERHLSTLYKAKAEAIKACEEMGYVLGLDPSIIFCKWSYQRAITSYRLYTERTYDKIRIDFALHGIDLDSVKGKKGKKGENRNHNNKIVNTEKDLGYKTFKDENGKERIIPDENRLYNFMNKLSGTGFSMR